MFEYHSERAYSISNDAAAIKNWRDGLSGSVSLALEPTNRYHLVLPAGAGHLPDSCRAGCFDWAAGNRRG
ncbi:MAG: hypothetical protein IT480_17615 [Gammaproteobacteria bacterium]|nr:hypothetical protein [Gammaproteobacteria bacterium]